MYLNLLDIYIYIAQFIEDMNFTFDILSSKNKDHKNPYKRALSENNPESFTMLQKTSKLMKNCQKTDKNNVIKSTPCLDGLTHTITGILLLYKEEVLKGHEMICTRRINQDAPENLFSVFRQK